MEGTRKLLVDKVNEFANSGGGGGDLQPTKESIANFFQKILEYLLHTFDPVWGFFVQIFDGMNFVESIANFFQKILEYLLHAFDPVWGFFVQTFDGISWGSFVESVGNFFQKLLEYLLHAFDPVWGFFVQTFDGVSWGSFVEKFDSIWGLLVEKWSLIQPDSETLHHWLRVGLTRFLPIALLLLLLSLCAYSRCFCFPSFLGGCFRGLLLLAAPAASRFLRGTGKMMKAPGRMGVTMLRASFEANPLGYFRALRAGGPHLS
ncbi:uncharacterized protein A4U43_C08F19650 [Asparagus officinalis]|uniref:uncharacterized protein LOC109822363 n=1 Tax=Asparagus officinalis TaxID=4686 RepID=UPI00098E4A74|nr:uncharacterized protein LOC109822363 [Asparagus officinalis]ONK60538.1 uncharacterized protein A4U43_C08F19650 [Asparagus officinalis]